MARTIRRPKTEPAEREFPYTPAAPALRLVWPQVAADPAAAAYAAPCPHYGDHGERISCTEAEARAQAAVRAGLTAIANGF